jgi:MATE family multidrug resistance protein
MGTTGFTAQAAGAGDEPEVRATLGRALLLAFALALAVLVLQWPILHGALWLLEGSTEVEDIAAEYFLIRVWAAPATLGTFALMGTLVGLGKSRTLLAVQIVLNGSNIAFDVWFAGVLGWGARGIAVGTLIAEWMSFVVAAVLVVRILGARHRDAEPFVLRSRLFDPVRMRRLLAANSDIMIRTLLLVAGFTWFISESARFGDASLAANHLLLEFVAFSAFFLDGFAFVAEAIVGQAVGARELPRFDLAVRRSTELAGATAVVLAVLILGLGAPAVRLLTDLEPVRGAAIALLPFAALYVLCSFAAFQLDGIFIGATRTRDMRNAAVLSVAAFAVAWWPLTRFGGNQGLWLAFVAYVCARAVALGWYYPGLRRAVAPERA